MHRRIALTACVAAACAPPGAPKYATTQPPTLPAAQYAGAVAVYVVKRAGLEFGTWAGRGGHNNFRIDVVGKPLPADVRSDAPRVTMRLGDVRSQDEALAEPEYVALECGWGFLETTSVGSVRAPCASRDRGADAANMLPRLRARFDELMRATAAAGGDAVVDVRCFGLTDPLRVFCEGTAAVLSPP